MDFVPKLKLMSDSQSGTQGEQSTGHQDLISPPGKKRLSEETSRNGLEEYPETESETWSTVQYNTLVTNTLLLKSRSVTVPLRGFDDTQDSKDTRDRSQLPSEALLRDRMDSEPRATLGKQ